MFGKGKKIKGKKLRGKKLSEFFISTNMFGWKENNGNKKIEEKLFSLICLCRKVKGKKKIMIPNDNFTFILL